MKQLFKRLTALILATAMCLSLVVVVRAEDAREPDASVAVQSEEEVVTTDHGTVDEAEQFDCEQGEESAQAQEDGGSGLEQSTAVCPDATTSQSDCRASETDADLSKAMSAQEKTVGEETVSAQSAKSEPKLQQECFNELSDSAVLYRAQSAGKVPYSVNIGGHNYPGSGAFAGNWARIVTSYLFPLDNGRMLRVDCTGGKVVVETYTTQGVRLDVRTLPTELTKFGGFHPGTDGYYFFFGQDNYEEDKEQEVIRVVKYSKNWERLGAASIKGVNIVDPFNAGTLRVAESGDTLYVRTCRRMYKDAEGLNHQANYGFSVRKSALKVLFRYFPNGKSGMTSGYGYVSHSFNQYITVQDNDLYAVDQGDGNPRAVVLNYCDLTKQSKLAKAEEVTILPFGGTYETYGNYTGACVGGVEVSSSHLLVVGNSIKQDKHFAYNQVRNIFVTSVPRDNLTDGAVQTRWLTHYSSNDKDYTAEEDPSNPQFVKLNDNRFLLLWKQRDKLNYTFLGADGASEGTIYKCDGELSDCKPIVMDNYVYWYVTAYSEPVFYSIDLQHPKTVTVTNRIDINRAYAYIDHTDDDDFNPAKESKDEYTYKGKAIKPLVAAELVDGENEYDLREDIDFDLEYENNNQVGTARIIINGKGMFTGKQVLTFQIVQNGKGILEKTVLSNVKSSGKNKITITWKKNTTGKGYQLQYSTDKKFKKKVKTVRISKNKTVKTTIKKLKKGTYYVRIRTVNGKNYSKWSDTKTVKVK